MALTSALIRWLWACLGFGLPLLSGLGLWPCPRLRPIAERRVRGATTADVRAVIDRRCQQGVGWGGGAELRARRGVLSFVLAGVC